MKRMPFERPTDYYDENLFVIDEKICELVKRRKDVSANNPGFPPFESISQWAEQFDLYEDFLKSLFASLRNEEEFRPLIEPRSFRKHLSVLKSSQDGNRFFTVTSIRQYENASVVQLNVDCPEEDDPTNRQTHTFFGLSISDGYDCRIDGGGGSKGHFSYNFVVSPALPDAPSGIDLVFKEYAAPFSDKETGLTFVVHLD
jgi:hypothetical protein